MAFKLEDGALHDLILVAMPMYHVQGPKALLFEAIIEDKLLPCTFWRAPP